MSEKDIPGYGDILSGFNKSIVLKEHPFDLDLPDTSGKKWLSIGNHTSMLVWMRENLDRGQNIECLRYFEPGSGDDFSDGHVIFFEAVIGGEAMMCAVKGFDGLNLFSMFLDLAHKYSQHLQRIEISPSDIADAQSTVRRYSN